MYCKIQHNLTIQTRQEGPDGRALFNQRLLPANTERLACGVAGCGMSGFDSLTTALEGGFDKLLRDLPKDMKKRIEQDFFPISWDNLSPDQRRNVAQQWDYRHDPATEQERQFWWDFFIRKNAIEKQIAEWKAVATPTAGDLAQQEARLSELWKKLARMEKQERQARGVYSQGPHLNHKGQGASTSSDSPPRFIAYPKAFKLLADRLEATPEEIAAWVWMGQKDGGLAAYLNANELNPPPRFYYNVGSGNDFDYLSPLMTCWFREEDIAKFEPTDRYLSGKALIERWNEQPGIQARAFIYAKIAESRLLDLHPLFGGTRGPISENDSFPPLESGLFVLAQVKEIEAADFLIAQSDGSSQKKVTSPEIGSSEWRSQNAQKAANMRHDQPGGSRDKQRQIREIWASKKYSSRDICAEQECAALKMSFTAARNALKNTPDP